MAAKEINCTQDCRWLNSASDEGPEHGRTPPVITNFGTYIYENRPDLQVAFPDPYGADRVAFSHWFTEVNLVGPAYLMRTSLCPFMSHGLKGQSHPLSQSTARQRALKPRRVSFDP
jgi:hypothetical protein